MSEIKNISVEIKNIKNIKNFNLDLPLEKGLYAFVGENGCGKSTIMIALSQLVKKSSLSMLSRCDYAEDSFIRFKVDDEEDVWRYNKTFKQWRVSTHYPTFDFPGFYEGSIFYGTRFSDSAKAEDKLPNLVEKGMLVDADDFVVEKLGWILHDDSKYYKNIKRIKTTKIAQNEGFKGIPYFYETDRGYISQLAMSSGECMLITLLHFVNNVLIRGNYKEKYKKNKNRIIMLLIDEVELALHPKAIKRLVEYMEYLTSEYELMVIFSSHSAEVIREINPSNIYFIENYHGNINITNPCYPSYAIRDLYTSDGFDFLLLVEDELAKKFVLRILRDGDMLRSKLVQVVPVGGYINTLKFHKDIVSHNVLGIGKTVISIIDGDAKEDVGKKEEFKNLKKLFLPIPSIEKYLLENLVKNKNIELIKMIGDKYFLNRSLKDILNDYKEKTSPDRDFNGKVLYKVLTSNLYENGMKEEEFIDSLCMDLIKIVDTTSFTESLKGML